MASRLSSFLAEMKRRKVYHVAVTYVVVAAGTIGLANDALGQIWERLPLVVLVLFLIGFPIALVLAWAYEVRPEEPRKAEEGIAGAGESSIVGDRKSIVVLPFDNMSPDPGDAYFADGLTEEIISTLSHLRSLRVISRSSAMVFKGTQKDVRTIGRELGVQYVLEGSVRKAGDDLRITAQLIDAAADEHLWAEKYDGVLEDVFGMQESVSRSIVEAMELQLLPKVERQLSERPIDNVQAYDWYLRARYAIESFTEEGFDLALQYLQNGLSIIGENALLNAGIGYTHWNRANQFIGGEDEVDKAELYARRALDLDSDCAEAHLVLGLVFQAFRGDQRQAFRHLKRSLAINPNDPHAVVYAFFGHYTVGRPEASQPDVERLMQTDPLNPLIRWIPAGIDLGTGRFDQAADFPWDELPGIPNFVFMRAFALVQAQRFGDASTLIQESVDAGWDDAFAFLCRFIQAAIDLDKEGLDTLLTSDLSRAARRDPMWSYWIGGLFALAGAHDAAFEWVTNAVDRGFINYPLLAEHDPFLPKLQRDPRYQALLERVRHEWENFEL
jgi:TolB-like protein